MIKMSTILLIGSIVITVVVGAPNFKDLRILNSSSKNLNAATETLKESIASIEPQLDYLKGEFSDVNLSTNYDIALSVSNFNGINVESIVSLITKDGSLYECSEVGSIDDVNFFNDSTEQIRFKMKLKNRDNFLKSLSESALVVRELSLNEKAKSAVLTVDAVFQNGEGA